MKQLHRMKENDENDNCSIAVAAEQWPSGDSKRARNDKHDVHREVIIWESF